MADAEPGSDRMVDEDIKNETTAAGRFENGRCDCTWRREQSLMPGPITPTLLHFFFSFRIYTVYIFWKLFKNFYYICRRHRRREEESEEEEAGLLRLISRLFLVCR